MSLPNDFTLATGNTSTANGDGSTETTVLDYTGDGTKMCYWNGTGSYAATWLCYIGSDLHSTFMTNDTERTAFVPFPSVAVPAGTHVYIKVKQDSGSNQSYVANLGRGV